jgi:hypothetical protein
MTYIDRLLAVVQQDDNYAEVSHLDLRKYAIEVVDNFGEDPDLMQAAYAVVDFAAHDAGILEPDESFM